MGKTNKNDAKVPYFSAEVEIFCVRKEITKQMDSIKINKSSTFYYKEPTYYHGNVNQNIDNEKIDLFISKTTQRLVLLIYTIIINMIGKIWKIFKPMKPG